MDNNAKLIEARIAQLIAAVTINDVLTQALKGQRSIRRSLKLTHSVSKREHEQ